MNYRFLGDYYRRLNAYLFDPKMPYPMDRLFLDALPDGTKSKMLEVVATLNSHEGIELCQLQ